MTWTALGTLPVGLKAVLLEPNVDDRGSFTEIFRQEWENVNAKPVQWNVMRSRKGVLRGLHVHPHHKDYLVIMSGDLRVGLKDLRRDSATYSKAATIFLSPDKPVGLMIPNGVGHAFYSASDTVLLYGVTEYYDPADELGCRWDDPGLEIPWKLESPILSQRDTTAPTLADLMLSLAEHHIDLSV